MSELFVRPIPNPSGTIEEVQRIRKVTSHRMREPQPQINQPSSDTLPGSGSGDQ